MAIEIQEKILARAAAAGMLVPECIIRYLNTLPVAAALDLPSVLTVLDEVLLERLSIQGKAWIWSRRDQTPRSYRSSLLDDSAATFERLRTAIDPLVSDSLAGYVDPRIAAYYSLPIKASLEWGRLYQVLKEQLTAEMQELILAFEGAADHVSDLSAADVRRFVVERCAAAGSSLEYSKAGSQNVFKVHLGEVLDLSLVGQIDIAPAGKKPYVDMSILSYDKQGALRARLGMDLVVSPYGNLYLAQRERRRDTLINLHFGLAIFFGVSDALREGP